MKKIFIILFIFTFQFSIAQFYDTEQLPSKIKWQQITTKHYDVIYPSEIDSDANRVANLLEYTYLPLSKTLNTPSKRYPILLSNQSMISNAYVQWAPRKSEWYNLPPQSGLTGTSEWFTLLATHEGRHWVQFDNMNVGFTKLGYLIGGEYTLSALSLFIPAWYWEGDAVGTETALTNSGRGRMPEFDMPLRANLLSGRKYSYYKSYLLSYKDYAPDHYCLGYHLTTNIKRKYGENALKKIVNLASSQTFNPFTFNHSLKKNIGIGNVQLYNETIGELDSLWRLQQSKIKLTNYEIINSTNKEFWTNYVYPVNETDTTIICIKYGLNNRAQLVRIDPNRSEKLITQISMQELAQIQINKNYAYWLENVPDIRWGSRSFTRIVAYDLVNSKKQVWMSKTNYAAINVSKSASKIIAIKFNSLRMCELHIIDAEIGRVYKRLPNPDNYFITNTSWSENEKEIVFIRQKYNGKALCIQNIESGDIQEIIKESNEDISEPVFYNNYIIYRSPFSGIDNLYAIDIQTLQRFQITSAKFGAFHPEISNDKKYLYYNDYSAEGYNIAKMVLNPANWIKIEEIKNNSINYYEPLVNQEQGADFLNPSKFPNNKYESKKYKALFHSFNFHSRAILPIENNINLVFYSNNVLNTNSLQAAASYDLNEKNMFYSLTGYYSKYFPIMKYSLGMGKRSTFVNDTLTDNWKEKRGLLGIVLPFNLSRGNFITNLSLESSIGITSISNREYKHKFEQGNGELFPNSYSINFMHFKKQSIRDLYSKFGIYLRFNYSNILNKDKFNGNITSLQSMFYLRGFFEHDNFIISENFEKQTGTNYHFPSYFVFSRGYEAVFKEKINCISLDYSFPIAYPDKELGAAIYIKRIKGNIFADYSTAKSSGKNYEYNSFGADLLFDFIPLSIHPQANFTLGIRFTYRLLDNKNYFSPVISYSF